ncbi:MAG: hypothetical protein K2M89_07590 [Clostridiales bacterium]|nr:hypothetical protein [Clostridiales bacterium]
MSENTEQNSTISTPTEKQYADFKSAYASVPSEEKRRAYTMLIAAGITLAVLLLSRLVWLLKPVLDLVYYGTLPVILYYIIILVIFTVFIIVLNHLLKKLCACRLFLPQKKHMDVPRTLAVILVGAIAMLCVSAGFKFKVKIQVEMGSGVTMATALINLAIYVYYGLHLWLGLTAAALVQRALTILFPTKFSVPWGSIFLVTVFGLLEFAFEFGTTTHLYPWLYYILTYAYAVVYELTDHSFHLTYWASIIIMVL